MDKTKRNQNSPVTLKITGMFLSEGYQQCKILAGKLRKHHKQYFREPVVKAFLEVDWIIYLSNLQTSVGGQSWAIRHGVVVYIDDVFIGGEEELFSYYRQTYMYNRPSADTIRSIAKEDYVGYLDKTNLLYTYMEFSVDQDYMGSLMLELQVHLLPRTCSRFAFFCDYQNYSGTSYRGSPVFRICKNGWFQAGRLNVQSRKMLNDESYCYSHDRRGIISFANNGKDSNNTEFFVTFAASRWMDQRYVAFGRVVEGWDLLRKLENTHCTYESPDKEIYISDCGLVKAGFGRVLTSNLRMRGVTVGEPHVDLSVFHDLILDYFVAALFDRLDEKVKRELTSDWAATLIWNTIEPSLKARQPIEDCADVNDASSVKYMSGRYFAGLYGPADVPDHYIKQLLNELIHQGLERHDITSIVKSIVSTILNTINYKSESELAALDLLNKLISDINVVIFGPKEESLADKPPSIRLSKILSDSLSKDITNTTFPSAHARHSSATKSLADYIWEILLDKIMIHENSM